jgi:nitroimidazol reductase NimA-like FMN-containing flavoprotein (pyridoxamine 5'-phosphate oxidase superfamily)
MLHSAPFGMLATEWHGQPYVKPILFGYDEPVQALYFHGAEHGHTLRNIQANPRACFSVCKMDRLLPAKTAMGFSMEYESVIVFGSAVLVTDPDEAQRGLQLLLDKYFPHLKPGEDYRQIIPEELNVTTVYRLDIEQWSGKANHAEGDHPGAFFYEDLPGEKKRAP